MMRLRSLVAAATATLALSTLSGAQNAYTSEHPLARRANAAACVLIEAWDCAAAVWGAVAQQDPEDHEAWYFYGLALGHLGKSEQAVEAQLAALDSPRVRAHALYELAVQQGRLANTDEALAALAEACAGGYYPAERDFAKRDFPELRGDARFADVIAELAEPAERLEALAQAGDHEGLVGLFHTLAFRWASEDTPTALDLVRGLALERAEAKSDKKEALLRAQLELVSAAADEAFGHARFSALAQRSLTWSAADAKQVEGHLKRISRLASSVRGHAFGKVIDGDREIETSARALGDPKGLMYSFSQRGLAHNATVSFSQPRKGVPPAQELDEAEAVYTELLELTGLFGELNLRDDALSGLAQVHLAREASAVREVEGFAFAAILQRPRLPFDPDDLGFFESLVLDKRAGKRVKVRR